MAKRMQAAATGWVGCALMKKLAANEIAITPMASAPYTWDTGVVFGVVAFASMDSYYTGHVRVERAKTGLTWVDPDRRSWRQAYA